MEDTCPRCSGKLIDTGEDYLVCDNCEYPEDDEDFYNDWYYDDRLECGCCSCCGCTCDYWEDEVDDD